MTTLSPLQDRILTALAGMEPRWVLFGGAALVGFVLRHRSTADLDLCFRDRAVLGEAGRCVEDRLRAAGLSFAELQTAPSFRRLRVAGPSPDDAPVVLDLVAEPIDPSEPPVEPRPGVLVDTPHELLVQKLCALLSRSEVRDLVDVAALLEAGGDLRRALADAARRDGGFSPPTLAWLLQSFPIERASALGFDSAHLEQARNGLVAVLLASS
ncbi:MAG: hypothetical protein A2138_09555 [Deltaproteobacteria bacterium RBG_16_71_12]|nr:MAG: hypothetical protein A2138_09555 [Deltaproteobacteria bacterium RBG_16_71_12]